MKRFPTLVTLVFLATAPAHAGSKAEASGPATKPTPDTAKDPIVQRILRDLQPTHPHLTPQDVVRTSNADLRKMYVAIFTQQGMKLLEAKQKAAEIPLKNR